MTKKELFGLLQKQVGLYYCQIKLVKEEVKTEKGNIIVSLLEDALKLCECTYVNIYMYELSMQNYNDEELFMGNYYCDYAVLDVNMMWERILNFLGIVYKIEFDVVPQNNTWDFLYKKLKKCSDLDIEIKDVLQKLIGDNAFGKLKLDRNNNEHDISVHLMDYNIDFNDKLEYTIDQYGNPILDKDFYEKFVWQSNMAVRKNKKDTIKKLEKQLEYFNEIFKKCFSLLKINIDLEEQICINNIDFYKYDFTSEVQFIIDDISKTKENFVIKADDIVIRLFKVRDRVKAIADEINMYPALIFKQPPTIQILEYNIDVAYRSVELIRTIQFMLAIVQPFEVKFKHIDSQITDYYYYYDYAIIRLYSLFEKIAKFLYVRFELDEYDGDKSRLKKIYLNTVIEIACKEKMDQIKPMAMLLKLTNSSEYKLYEQIRNKTYHSIGISIGVVEAERGNLEFASIKLMLELMEQLTDILEVIEEGEDNNLAMSKILRSKYK